MVVRLEVNCSGRYGRHQFTVVPAILRHQRDNGPVLGEVGDIWENLIVIRHDLTPKRSCVMIGEVGNVWGNLIHGDIASKDHVDRGVTEHFFITCSSEISPLRND